MSRVIINCCFVVLLFSCNATNTGDYKKVNQAEVERMSPRTYLKLNCETYIGNNNKLVINGTVRNYSGLAKYKDVILQVFCIDSAGHIVQREQLPAIDFIHTQEVRSFKMVTLATDNTAKVEVKLFDATGVK
jgi:hypothetical protein